MKKIICLFVCLFISSASAVPIFFNDRASFDAATTGGNLNFESFESDFATAQTIAFTGFSVSETGSLTNNLLGQLRDFPGVLDAAITDGTGALLLDDNGNSIGSFFSFTDSVNAFGLDIVTDPGSIITIGGSVSNIISLTADTPLFWGVIDRAGITSLTFDASLVPRIGFDAVSFGQISVSVAEPATLVLLSFAITGIAFSRKNKTA